MTPEIYRKDVWSPLRNWFPAVFDEFLNNDFITNSASNVAPSVNVKDTKTAYLMELAAPGVKKEFCRVSVDDEKNLCVAIENKFEHKEEDKNSHYLRREFSYTNFEQKYSLPDDVEVKDITAKVEDGILSIELPKIKQKEKVKLGRQINID